MRKNIKNYTSRDTVTKSLNHIQQLLASKKAEKIMIDYKDGEPVAITFLINSPKGLLPIRLPARIEGVAAVMYGARLNQLNNQALDQVKRTAWKNIFDWIDAQIALVETEMVKLEEVFLPYIVIGQYTVFEKFESGTLLGDGQ
ncbi:MAG TPA: hypothetical protein VD999_05655 [Vitreimonas sp.]|nr:hypothetical protein [Vitreimonas sp.]